MLLTLNNKSDYTHLIQNGEDFHIPEKPLPKIEVRLKRIISLQSYSETESDEYIDAIKNLVWLNRSHDTAFLTSSIPGILQLKIPDDKAVIELVKEFIKAHREGKLKPEYTGEWWVISKEGYNAQGKHKLFEEKINIQKISDSIEELKLGYEKITQASVSDCSGVSLRTVKTRWAAFKDDVKEFNNYLKERSSYIDDTELE